MGVPCASKSGSGGDDVRQIAVTSSFVPSNAYNAQNVSSAEAATFVLDGLGGPFVFVGGQQWLDYENNTAVLTAEIADATDRERRFAVDLRASNFNLARELPEGSFDLRLEPTSYKDGGGTVDPSGWTAYSTLTGTLTGLRDLAGTDLDIQLTADTLLQVGDGANNQNAYFGAFADFTWHRFGATEDDEDGNGTGSMSLTLQGDTVARATAANSVMPFHGAESVHAVTLPGISANLVFVAGGRFTERPDGTARLAGVLQDLANPALAFHMDLRLEDRVGPDDEAYPPTDSPKLELNTSSYLENGGPIDPATWTYYESFEGTLVGLRDAQGAEIEITRRGPAFQVGIGANSKNGEFGGSGWLNTVVVTQPSSGLALPGSTGGDININLDSSGTVSCAGTAERDGDVARYSGGHALWIPGLARDFLFEPGAVFVERADGSARLEGVVYSSANPELRFYASADLADRIDPQAPGYAPQGSPKLELQSSAYVANGGTVDPNGWHYYGTLIGSLEGLAMMRGAEIHLERRGPAFQVGFGANGKNQRYGACGWLDVTIVSQPAQGGSLPDGITHGDFNINLGEECSVCTFAAPYDAELAKYQGGHAFYLPGISHDFIFESGASFVERADGTAQMRGVLMSPSRPGWRFNSVVNFSDRVDPSDAQYPPTNSPKKELVPSSFIEMGGPIDTNSWRYYTDFSGRLEGLDELEGAVVDLTLFGAPFQIGPGAAGKSHAFGGAGWLDVVLVEQPTTGVSLPSTLPRGDINVDFSEGCTTCAVGAVGDPNVSRIGGSAAFYLGGLGSQWFDFEGPGSFEERGDGTATLTGVLRDYTGDGGRWSVELHFDDRFDPINGDPLPADSPKRDLLDERFAENGGPIDFEQWRYYTQTTGELLGLGEYEGARIEVWRMGPAFQVGHGASGRNERFGASGWLHTSMTAQPNQGVSVNVTSGDFNIDLGGECDLCARAAGLDANATSTSGDHSFYFPGIGTDFVFEGPAPFIENADGTARLTGEIYRPNEPTKRFRVEVDFGSRVDPGMGNYPPTDSPKLELRPEYYRTGGGDIEPGAWRYYETVEGRAIGMDAFEGGELYFTRFGPSFQVGPGASGKNTNFGGAAWLDMQILSHPSSGPEFVIPLGFHGDINIDLQFGCE